MEFSPLYIEARNAITQPDRMVYVSQYFRRHWMPLLGPLGAAIVIYLRGACYHNRKSGETRDTVQISQKEIAQGCGCSVPTLKRELERNEVLRRFVTISQEWERDPASGRVRQLENHYQVAMDDPLTAADEIRLREMVEQRLTEQQAQTSGGKRIRRGSGERTEKPTEKPTEKSPVAQNELLRMETPPVAQNELLRPVAHFEPPSVQNELLYNESLLKTTKEQTLNVRKPINKVDSHCEKACSVDESHGTQDSITAQAARVKAHTLAPCAESSTLWEEALTREAEAIVAELQDFGSERRHRQLLSICDQHSLHGLPQQALQETRKRIAQQRRKGLVENPGAYYQHVLLALLEARQVFVPKKDELGEDDPDEVRRAIRASLGGGLGTDGENQAKGASA